MTYNTDSILTVKLWYSAEVKLRMLTVLFCR